MKRTILAIAGPTAAGKTEYSIRLAKAFSGEIISADSMQIYRHMDIGSAKPSPLELAHVKHHLIGFADPKAPFSAADYQREARACIEQVFSQGKLPVISGGTGLYINSILYDMDFSSTAGREDLRRRYEEAAALHGNQWVHERLRAMDPEAAKRIHPNNLKRVIRAMELLEYSGEGLPDFARSFCKTSAYEAVIIGLTWDREELYQRIEQRVDILMAAGLLQEVKELLDLGLSSKDQSMQGIGYKEIIGHLEGLYSLEEAVFLIKRNTRRYAKRQLTWFRRLPEIRWFNLSEYAGPEEAFSAICNSLKERFVDYL